VIFTPDFWTVDLITAFGLLAAVIAIILLMSSEVLSAYKGKTGILIDTKRLRNVSIATTIVFFVTVAIKIIDIIWPQTIP
jgi:hypothetical protein